MHTVLFVGGGSVGHIAPGIAVMESLKLLLPDLHAHFICSERPDDVAFLQAQRVEFTPLPAPRLSMMFPWKFITAYRKSNRLITVLKPTAVFSKGGYVSLPLCIAAAFRGIPIILHESDAVSGYANRLIGYRAKRVCQGFPIAHRSSLSTRRYTGNPVRSNITQGSREQGLKLTGLSGKKPILLVIGGSQGAQAINESVIANLSELWRLFDVIHITGRGKNTGNIRQPNTDKYYSVEFATDTLPHIYACTHIALSRAGAGSIAELAANRIPAILVPLRGVGHDHQYVNAKTVENAGGCIYLEQNSLNTQLLPQLRTMTSDTALLTQIRRNIATFHLPDAASQIAGNIAECLADYKRDQ